MIMESLTLSNIFLFTIISLNTFSSYASNLSYTDHCASMIPSSTPKESNFNVFPHGQRQRGYYIGGGTSHPQREEQKQVTLQMKNVYETDVAGILNVGARLIMGSGTWYYRVHDANFSDARMWSYDPFPSSVTFSLDGFWSESSGKLCMVETETGQSPQLQRLEVVLKLYNVFNSSNTVYTLVTGSLESMSAEHEVSYFEPISVFIFPRMDYEYSFDTKEAKNEYFAEAEVVPGLSINPVLSFCSSIFPIFHSKYDLQYTSDCINSAKNCSPVEGDTNRLPYVVSLRELVCSDVERRVRVLIGFGNIDPGFSWSFNPNSTLVGEGWWDEMKNQLCIVGCHFLGMEESMVSVHVGDCSTRMRLRFPKIWSINGASSIMGQIWSNKAGGDSGYFNMMTLRSQQDKRNIISGMKYEYSQLDKVRKLCPRQEPEKSKGTRYPIVYSSDKRLDFYVEYFGQKVAWGYSVPFVINGQIQQLNSDENFVHVPFIANEQRVSKFIHTQSFISANSSSAGLYNVSYKISLYHISFGLPLARDAKIGEEKFLLNETEIHVSAEGVYDAEAGSLCMVGCRNLGSQNQIPTADSMDCEIIVKFQFQLQITKNNNNGLYIEGSIESLRNNSDPLYFNPLNLTSVGYCSNSYLVFSQLLSCCSFFLPILLYIPLLLHLCIFPLSKEYSVH